MIDNLLCLTDAEQRKIVKGLAMMSINTKSPTVLLIQTSELERKTVSMHGA